MGQRRKLRTLLRIFRDKVSIIRASVSLNRASSAVLRATTSSSSSSSLPSDRRLSAVLRLGCGSRITARACVSTLINRLHSTADAAVALKTLITLHTLISRSSSIIHDQLSSSPASGGLNPLNLSSFRDDSDAETWELSSWVRWYAEFLDQTIIVSRTLGYFLISPPAASNRAAEQKIEKLSALSNSDLIREVHALASLIELISNSPESVHLLTNNLVYEAVRLVCGDYGRVRGETSLRLVENGDRLEGLGHSELTEVLTELDRVEGCMERLLRLFGNRKNSDGLWDTVTRLRMKVSAMKERNEGWKLVVKKERADTAELTQFRGRVAGLLEPAPPVISTVG